MVATTTTLPRRSVAGGPKFDHILNCATHVFYEKGYEGASIRDIARQGHISLAGLYYYVGSKEELLYLIQKICFTTLLARLQEQLDSADRDPESRLRILIHNHIHYFLQNREAMKVLSHEADTLNAPFADEVTNLKRSYYRLCRDILEDLKRERKLRRLNPRLAMLSLFGMMNWIYTWYNPRKDPDAEALAEQMAELFLGGIQATRKVSGRTQRLRNGRDRSSAS